MSATTQFTTFSDLYNGLLRAVRANSSQTTTSNDAKQYICTAHFDMYLNFDYKFPWAERQGALILQDPYETGTVTITKGSTSLTGASTAWNTNNDFGVANMRTTGKILLNGGVVPYRINTVSSNTAATLSTRFTETSVSAGTYIYYEDEYNLAADFLRPVDAQQFSHNIPIALLGRTEFRQRYPRNITQGKPAIACIEDYAPSGSTTPIRRVRVNRVPDTTYTIEYHYITANIVVSSAGAAQTDFSADTDEPIIPLRYRHAIFYHALSRWYRDKRDDTRSAEAKAEYTDILMRISGDTEIGDRRPQLRPRIGTYARAAMRPWRGSAQRYSLNNSADRLEDFLNG